MGSKTNVLTIGLSRWGIVVAFMASARSLASASHSSISAHPNPPPGNGRKPYWKSQMANPEVAGRWGEMVDEPKESKEPPIKSVPDLSSHSKVWTDTSAHLSSAQLIWPPANGSHTCLSPTYLAT